MDSNLPLSFIIISGSLTLNFLIPYSYFLYVTRIKGKSFAPLRAIDSYLSGMVGDTLCVPLINLFLFKTVYGLPVSVNLKLLAFSFIMGILVTGASHTYQALVGPVNWSMPEPWRWSFPGKYHMLSATIQYSYLSLMLFAIFSEKTLILLNTQRIRFLATALFFVILFLVFFTLDYKKKGLITGLWFFRRR